MENTYRISAVGVFLIGAIISIDYRRRADRESGEKLSPLAEGLPIMIALRVTGMTLWLAVFTYLVNPGWLAWSQVDLPSWLRWLGLGLGILADLFS